jgi:hypothetical protein
MNKKLQEINNKPINNLKTKYKPKINNYQHDNKIINKQFPKTNNNKIKIRFQSKLKNNQQQ